jgi:hypothetical protein
MEKDFDCVEMKNDIHAKIYAETKDMNFEEYKAYLAMRLENSYFRDRIKQRQIETVDSIK